MKDFLELAKKRYSVRKFKEKPVEDSSLQYVLEAGRIAPSAANFQPWHTIVIREKDIIKTIGSAYPRPWFIQAPVILIICGDHEKAWKRSDGKDHTDIDIAILVDHMTLAAVEKDLGTCWVCNFDPKKVSEILQLPPTIEPIVLLPLGYPDDLNEIGERHLIRNEMSEIVHWNKF